MKKIITFFNNLRYLSRYNLKGISKRLEMILDTDMLLDQVRLEQDINSGIARPKIENIEKTIDILINSNKSIARFGDGELELMLGGGIPFQEYDHNLSEELKAILQNQNDSMMVCINYHYFYAKDIILFNDAVRVVYRVCVPKVRDKLSALLNWNSIYFSAEFTQLYQMFKNYPFDKHFEKMRQIWDNKKLLIVCGKGVFSKIDYNIFDNAQSISYEYLPSRHAFSERDNIIHRVSNYSKDHIIVLIAGPTATVLANDLSNLGYRALDLGHIAKDYDYYMKQIERTHENIIQFMRPDD